MLRLNRAFLFQLHTRSSSFSTLFLLRVSPFFGALLVGMASEDLPCFLASLLPLLCRGHPGWCPPSGSGTFKCVTTAPSWLPAPALPGLVERPQGLLEAQAAPLPPRDPACQLLPVGFQKTTTTTKKKHKKLKSIYHCL